MQHSPKQISIKVLLSLLVTLVCSVNILFANVPNAIPVCCHDTIPVVSTDTTPAIDNDTTSVVSTDTVPDIGIDTVQTAYTDTTIYHYAGCDSLYLPFTDRTYYASATVEFAVFDSAYVIDIEHDSTFVKSLSIYDIEVDHPTNDTIKVATCSSMPFLFLDSVYTESTVVTHILTSKAGCDSIVTLDLTVNKAYDLKDTIDITICENELPYVFDNDTLYYGGTFNFQKTTACGCDSLLLTVNLIVNSNPMVNSHVAICGNDFPYQFDENHSFDAPGFYTIVHDDTLACHEITFLQIHLLPTYYDTLFVSICDVDTPYVYGDTSFSSNTVYTIYDQTEQFHCDSLTTLVLDIHPTYHDTVSIRQYACRSDLPFYFADSTLTESGEYEIRTKSQFGCDSTLVLLSFQVLENIYDTLDVSLCSNEFPYIFDSLNVFDSVGTYTIRHQVEPRQCPDFTTLRLTSRPSYNDTTVVTICSTEVPYFFADSNFTESTVYTKYDTTILGCDSISTLVLTVNPAYPGIDTLNTTICSIDLPFIYGNDTLTEPGTYDFHLITNSGCDSTDLTINLSIIETPYDTVSLNICSNDFPFNYCGNQIDSAGEYDLRIIDSVLCDTMRHLYINTLPTYHDSIFVVTCANEPYQIGDTTFTEPGIYDILLQTEAGCDSLITLTLEHNPIYRDSIQHFSICENQRPFIYDGVEYNDPDTVVLHYQTVNGCDSLVTFVLEVLPVIYNSDTIHQEICRDELPYNAFGEVLAEAGTYTFVTTSVVTGCDSVFYLRLVVHDNPAPVITGADYLCEGSVSNLMVESEPCSYIWNNGNTNQMLTIEAAGHYTVTATNEFGCSGTAIKDVTAAVLPDINISGTASICYGDSSVISISGADHYVWDNGSRATSITVHPTVTTVYNVTAYTEEQCSRSGNFTVVVNALPTPIITGTTTICAGDSTHFSAAGGVSYQWSTGQTDNRITVTEAGIYALTVTNANGCRNTASQILTVNAKPNIHINGRTSFCQGSSNTISATGAVNYAWSSGEQTSAITTSYAGIYTVTGTAANGCSSTANITLTTSQIQATITGDRHFCQGESTTLSVSGNDNYTYRWYDGSTTRSISVYAAGTYSVVVSNEMGCSNTISTTVSEYALPNPSITGSSTICAGRSTQLRATGGNSYLWDDGSTQAFISVNMTGTYAVTVTNQQGCSASTSATVIVNPLPEINILTTNNICGGESVTISAYSPAATSYSWTNGQNASIINVQPAVTTSYTVLVIDENGCSNSASTTINVNERPDPYINGDRNICQGSSTTLTAFGGNTYRWSNGETTQSINVSTAGTYTVTVSSAASSACTAVTQATVNVNQLPIASITEDAEICQGQTTTIEITAVNCTYEWSNSGRSSSISVRNAGTYTVTATNTTTGCSTILSSTVTVNELPSVQINGTTNICAGEYTNLVASSNSSCSYRWNNGINSAINSVNTTGEYTVTVTDVHQCSNTASLAVNVLQLPTPKITGTAVTCLGQSTTLTSSTAASYTWSTGETTRSIIVMPNATTTYTLTVTNSFGCQKDTSFTVSISNVPNFLITGADAICAGQTTQLTATGNYSYRWSNNATTQSINVTQAGTYTVTATNADGCLSAQSFQVTVNALPTVQINGRTSLCAGDRTTLTASSNNNCSYRWNDETDNAANTIETAGVYSVTATDDNGCSNSASVRVTAFALPTPSITGTLNICPGTSTQLTVSDATSYRWSTNDTTRTITVSPSMYSTYTVTVTNAQGCQGSASVNVQLFPTPTVIINGSNAFCEGQSSTLTATSGFSSYRWSNENRTPSIEVFATDDYSVTVTDQNGCQAIATKHVNVKPLPVINFTGNTQICQGTSTSITAVSQNGNGSYIWSNGTTHATATFNASGTYAVTATIDGCSSSNSVTIIAYDNPVVNISGESSICQGTSNLLVASDAYRYHWSNGDTTKSIIVTPQSNNVYTVTVTDVHGCQGSNSFAVNISSPMSISISGPTDFCLGETPTLSVTPGYHYVWSTSDTSRSIVVSTSGKYKVTATNNIGCSISDSITVTAHELPELNFGMQHNICEGQSFTYSLPADPTLTYSWSNNATGNTITVANSGIYTVTATNQHGCKRSASDSLYVRPLPIPTISGNAGVCPGQSTTLTASTAATYEWSTGEATRSITVTPSATSVYTLTVTNAYGCRRDTSFTVTLNNVPDIIITGADAICAGQTAQLTASGNYSYRWSNDATSQSINVTQAGTYSVTATNANGCQAVQSFNVAVNALPTIQINGRTSICTGERTTLTASSNSTCSYRWNDETENATNTIEAAGVYSVTATDENGCSNSASVRVTAIALPNPSITGTLNICPGTSTQLTASDAVSYHWSTNDTTRTITVSPSMFSTYTVTVTNAQGCQGSASINVQLFPTPTVTINGNSAICAGQTSTLTATSGFSSYRWSDESRTPAIEVFATDNYSVTVTDQNGCQAIATKWVNVKPLPAINFSGNTQICQGQSTNITALSNSNCSYIWSNGTTNATATFNTAGTYTVTATQEGCTNSNSVTISLYNNPIVNITGTSTICPGSSTILTASDAAHYIWSNGDTTKNISVIPQASTAYTVTVTDNHGCQGSSDFTVQLSSVPDLSIIGQSTICAGETTQLTATGDYTYRWSTNETTASITVNQPSIYTVTATNNNGCTSEASINVIVNSLPVVSLTGNTSACYGSAAQVTADGGQSCTYQWSDGSTNAARQFTESGLYTVVVTNTYGCTSTDSTQITIFNLPTPVISGESSLCSGETTHLTVTNAVSYLWSTGDTTSSITTAPTVTSAYNVTVTDEHGCQGNTGFAITISDPVSVSISGPTDFCYGETPTLSATPGYHYVWSTAETSSSITITAPGTYKVTATNDIGCSAEDSITITSHELPELNFGMQHSICEGQSFTYSLPVDSNITYTWSNNATGNSITVYTSGLYAVTATNQFGCTRTASDTLYVRALPVPSITGASTICQGNHALLTAHGGVSYHWSNGSNTSDIAVFPNTTTTYAVTASNEYGCSATASVIVNVNVLPSITFTGNHYFCEGSTTTINVMGGATYNWSTGDRTSSLVIGTAGTYTVSVTNTLGCQRSDSIVITSRANPNVTVTGNNPLCFGQSELLMASGANSYVWSTGENSSNIMVMPSSTTTYTVTGTNTYGCSTVVSKVVAVEELPNLHISGITTICNGETVTMTASGASSYHWSNDSNNSSITVNQGGTYTVTGTSANGCHNTESITVTVNPSPVANLTGSNTICDNSTMELHATGGDAYLWNTGATSDAITINEGGAYSVTVTNTYGCSSSASINVSTLASPFLQIIGNASTCNGSSINLIASTNANYYSWSNGEHAQNITVAPTSSQYFKVTVTNALGCTSTDSIFVTVHPTYHDTINGSTCQGNTFSQYGFDLPIQNEAGEFYHTQHLFTTLGCDSIVTLRLTVNPLPIIDSISGATLVGYTGSQIFTAVNPQYTNIIEWRISNTSWNLIPNLNTVQVNITGAGSGTLTAKAINECGFTEKSVLITCNVGIEERLNETNILLYPNPVHNTLNIDLSNTQLEVEKVQLIDNLGRCLQNIPATEDLLQLDCTPYASGVYYVKFINKEYQTIETRKIIIK